jgi:hypothetical protein
MGAGSFLCDARSFGLSTVCSVLFELNLASSIRGASECPGQFVVPSAEIVFQAFSKNGVLVVVMV